MSVTDGGHKGIHILRRADECQRALDDIRGSIRELKFYRDHMFIPVSQAPPLPPPKDGQADQVSNEKGESEAARMVDKTGEH